MGSNLDPFGYEPDTQKHTITIVVISRLFYNKGTDLLTAAIPRILENHPNTRFIIAGSGPKAIDLKQMIEQNVLQDRVEMLGPVRHEDVRNVMVRGQIYLHPSLTEAQMTPIQMDAFSGDRRWIGKTARGNHSGLFMCLWSYGVL